MSIINQALQKAQREQLRHSQQEMPYRLSAQRTRAPRRRWLLALLGLVAAVGVGVTLHAWFLIPTGRVPVPTELASTSSPLVTPIPPATPLPATPVVEPGTEPPLPERHARPLPLGSEPPPLAPVVASADTLPSAAMPLLDVFDLKGVVEGFAAGLHLCDVGYRPASMAYLHPGKAAELLVGGQAVGAFGVLHPKVALAYELGNRPVLVAEFDMDAILAAVPSRHSYAPVPRFPAALRDIAVIIDEQVTAERVVTEIRAAGAPLLRDVRLFDLYRGESIPADKKSLAYALSYQADDRTLTDKEVDKAHKKIEDRLKHVLKALIRGEE